MAKKTIKITVADVKTESGICPGIAKTKVGEEYILTGRTPENPMCLQALNAIFPTAHLLSLTEKMEWEKKDYFEVVCPHGKSVFHILRINKFKAF